MFPSPYGDYGSYRKSINNKYNGFEEVSVPLRGLWFLSIGKAFVVERRRGVSVPLRGLWFLSHSKEGILCLRKRTSFRPLTGIMVLIFAMQATRGKKKISFRPLTGIMVLIKDTYKIINKQTQKVSVPLRGLWFLSTLCITIQ